MELMDIGMKGPIGLRHGNMSGGMPIIAADARTINPVCKPLLPLHIECQLLLSAGGFPGDRRFWLLVGSSRRHMPASTKQD